MRKVNNWRYLKRGDLVQLRSHEFDGDCIMNGIVFDMYADHCIITGNGMSMYIDDDTAKAFEIMKQM